MVDGEWMHGIARSDVKQGEWGEFDPGYVIDEPEFEGYVIRVTPWMFWICLSLLVLVGFGLGFLLG